MKQNITFSQKFREFLWPLSDEEYKNLERSLLENGFDTSIYSPIVIWNNIIIDGHNRYEICKKHNIEFQIKEVSFENEEEAKIWIIDNQLSRRNLDDWKKYILIKRKEEMYAKIAKERMSTEGKKGGNKTKFEYNSNLLNLTNSNKKGFLENKKPLSNTTPPPSSSKPASEPQEKQTEKETEKNDKTESTEGKREDRFHVREKIAEELKVSASKVDQLRFIDKYADEKTKQRLEKGEVSTHQVYKQISKEKQKEKIKEKLKDTSKEIENKSKEKKYRVIYADPPWKYAEEQHGSIGTQEKVLNTHYPSMTIQELCELPISKLSEKNSVLWLWVTSPLLEEAFEVINAWGFQYKTSMIWDKINHNVGNYVSVRHELLLICTKGSCTPDNRKLFDSVQSIQKTKKHSQKPEEFRKIIDTIYTYGNKIELFSRGSLPKGWDTWGNETDNIEKKEKINGDKPKEK